jgi:hypothetical protein
MARRIREEIVDDVDLEPTRTRRIVTERTTGAGYGMGMGMNPLALVVAAVLIVFILLLVFGAR